LQSTQDLVTTDCRSLATVSSLRVIKRGCERRERHVD
jgi:hypothetical protein